MNFNYTIYFDKENNVKLVVSQGKVLFVFLPSEGIDYYRSVEILKDNNFSMNDLVKLWEKQNLPLDMLDTINKVCKKFYRADFLTAHKILPSAVIDQSDLNEIYSYVVSSNYGLVPARPEELRRQAKIFATESLIVELTKELNGRIAIENEYKSNFGNCDNALDVIVGNKKHFVRYDIYSQNYLKRLDRESGYYIPEKKYANLSENKNILEQYINDEFYGANK